MCNWLERKLFALRASVKLNNFFRFFIYHREEHFYICRMSVTKQARALRRKSTWAERLVWSWLRSRRFSAYKFRRNHPVGEYFLDFYCAEASLAIELDGGGHGQPRQQAHDAERTRFLGSYGITVLRFWNSQLRRNRQEIRDAIFCALQKRAPHGLPSYTRPLEPSGSADNND
jgi:very-short-patch-repair endonuclease